MYGGGVLRQNAFIGIADSGGFWPAKKRIRMHYGRVACFTSVLLLGMALCNGCTSMPAAGSGDTVEPTQLLDSVKQAAKRGDADATITLATQALTELTLSEREAARIHFFRGAGFQIGGQYDKAIADYNETLRLSPLFLDAIKNRARAYVATGQFNLAIDDLTEALSMERKDIPSLMLRCAAYNSLEQFDKALADCNKAVQFVPEDDKSASSNPVFAAAYDFRANLYESNGKYDLAISDYSRSLALKPDDIVTLARRCVALGHKKAYDQAMADCNKVFQLDSKGATGFLSRGVLYALEKHYDLAIADFNEVLQRNPSKAMKESALYDRGSAFDNSGDYDHAIADFNEALLLRPDDDESLLALGLALERKGDFDRAGESFDRALQLRPEDDSVLYVLGRYHFRRQDFSRAADEFGRALVARPDNAYRMIWRFLSMARCRIDGGDELAKRSGEMKSHEWPYPVIGYLMGRLDKQGLLEAAKSDDATTANNHLCEVSAYTGEMELIRGDKESALALFRDAQSRCPHSFVEFDLAQAEVRQLTGGY